MAVHSADTVPAIGWELRCTSGSSNKFYRIVAASTPERVFVFCVHGRIGTDGIVTTRSHTAVSHAAEDALKTTRKKLSGDYLLTATATAFELPAKTVASLDRTADADERRIATNALRSVMDLAIDHARTRCTGDPDPDLSDLHRHVVALGSGVPAEPDPWRPAPAPPARKRRPRRHLTPVGPAARPNGEVYQPRTIGDHEDLALMRAAQRHGDSVLLYGCPGTGKTALLDAAFPDAEQLIGTADTTEADLVGAWIQDPDPAGAGFVWAPGPLQRSLQNDVPLFIDEIALIDPRVLSALYPLLDGRNELHITVNPSLPPIKRGGGWILVGAFNPDVPGAHLSDALRDRFAISVGVGSDFQLARELGVNDDLVTVAENLDERRRNGEISWSPQLRALLTFTSNRDRYGAKFALANLVGTAPAEDREVILDALRARFSITSALELGRRHRP